MPKILNVPALLLVVIVLAAGCISSSEPTAAAADQADSPLNRLLGIPITDEAAMREYETQLTRDAERLVAECMLAAGFDYVPAGPPSAPASEVGAIEGSREYAEAFGLGLAVLVDELKDDREQVDPGTRRLRLWIRLPRRGLRRGLLSDASSRQFWVRDRFAVRRVSKRSRHPRHS